MAVQNNLRFSAVDYILFGLTLALSLAIGLYFQLAKKKQTSGDLLTGGGKIPIIPIAMSLMASFVSGISFLALPAEMYVQGAEVCWIVMGAVLASLTTAFLIIPSLYHVQGVSIYRYLQIRFDSKGLRLYGSVLFTLSNLMWSAVVLYAPSVALAEVSGFDTWILILSVGSACTLYTAMGGLKAVVWTDTFQAFIMYGGLVAALVKGSVSVGLGPEVIDINKKHGRVSGFSNFDFNPLQYMTVWIAVLGGGVSWLGGYGTSQLAQQRYRSLPTMRKAQLVILLNIPIIVIIYFLIYYNAMIMFAHYVDCDPLKAGFVKTRDQLVVYYTMDLLEPIYGLPGLFLSSICSATLSTLSSAINAMSAVAVDDFIGARLKKKLDEKKSVYLTKGISLMFGVLITCLAFAAEPLGGIFVATQKVLGVLGGPLVGLMMLGILVPKAERIGAWVGTLVGTCLVFWIFIGSEINKVSFAPLPTSIDGCIFGDNGTNTLNVFNSTIRRNYTTTNDGVFPLYKMSFSFYPFVGAFPVLVFGVLVSYAIRLFGRKSQKVYMVKMDHVEQMENK